MLVTKFLLAAAAFTLANCQIVAITNSDFSGIKVGVPFNITWSGATSDITLKLKNGPKDAQLPVLDIVTGATGNSFSWVPPSTLVPGTYNFEIDHLSDPPNYSVQFSITGGSGSSSSAGSSASAALSTSAKPSATTSAASGSSTVTTTSPAVSSSASSKSSGTTTVVASNTTASVTTTVTRASGSSTSTAVPSANNAAQYASPFAFVLLSFAAMIALN